MTHGVKHRALEVAPGILRLQDSSSCAAVHGRSQAGLRDVEATHAKWQKGNSCTPSYTLPRAADCLPREKPQRSNEQRIPIPRTKTIG